MRVLLAGATGLVGARALDHLVEAGHAVTAVGRRSTGRPVPEVIASFDALPALPDADAAVCALGTTIAAAGSRAAFRAVDHDAVLAFAGAARAAGASRFVAVTAVGADPRAGVFYSRVKGEVEQALAGLGFARLDLLQPGLLLGPRAERRPVEALLQRLTPVLNPLLVGPLDRYGAIEADRVAAAIVALLGRDAAGVHRHENAALRALASGVP
jgi:uncharacterized protein YbjT (DUF2867 family)